MKLLVTGGAGFIGSAFIRKVLQQERCQVCNLDKLTYASSLDALDTVNDTGRYEFVQGDIRDTTILKGLFARFQPDAVVHFAAESHVDRSIDAPDAFIETNIVGTYSLLKAALPYWEGLAPDRKISFRLLHISTDEVFGSLGAVGYFDEKTPYAPNSPYSASKAAADHLVRAWYHTYGLPTLVSNCSNNYGPYQFPEKLIPLMLINALEEKPLPLYGDGLNVRDWLHVDDHVQALLLLLEKGKPGEQVLIGGRGERSNRQVVESICTYFDKRFPQRAPHSRLITPVPDRRGHDRRYAVDAKRFSKAYNWQPRYSFESGLEQTITWYLENPGWWQPLRERYQGQRLGLGHPSAVV